MFHSPDRERRCQLLTASDPDVKHLQSSHEFMYCSKSSEVSKSTFLLSARSRLTLQLTVSAVAPSGLMQKAHNTWWQDGFK